jgi:hypothetical protein
VTHDELDSDLRALGYNRPERERLRRSDHLPKARDQGREEATAVKRLGLHIDKQVNWAETDLSRAEVIAAWAALCNHDVDKANDWWGRGVHPLDIAEITKLTDYGFQPTDLYTIVNKKTIMDHIRDGTSVEWCRHALRWAQKSQPHS